MTVQHPDVTPDHPHNRLLGEIFSEVQAEDTNPASATFFSAEDIDEESVFAVRDALIGKCFVSFKLVELLPEPIQMKVKKALAAVWEAGFKVGYLFALKRTDR